ncbi:MAG: cupin domain-containing protein [Thaumarchaeota archaeon]|nr:cupin domain-containing protein [Nitrososphaerota archaeon]
MTWFGTVTEAPLVEEDSRAHSKAKAWMLISGKGKPVQGKNGMFVSEKLDLTLLEYGIGGGTPHSQHPNNEQVFYVLEGSALMKVGEEERVISPGSVVYIPVNVPHSYKVVGDRTFKYLQFNAPPEG